MTSFYVYYRVADVGTASRRVRALFAALRERFGIQGRLLRKVGESSLWMEIYEEVPDAAEFERELARLVKALGIEATIAAGSSRKAEVFESL